MGSLVLEDTRRFVSTAWACQGEENVYVRQARGEQAGVVNVELHMSDSELGPGGVGMTEGGTGYRVHEEDYRPPLELMASPARTRCVVDESLGGRALSLPPRTVLQALEDDLAWVRENVDRLIAEWGRVYLAVRDGQIFDADRDRGSLAMRLFHEHPYEGLLVVSLDDPRLRAKEGEPDVVPGAIDEDRVA